MVWSGHSCPLRLGLVLAGWNKIKVKINGKIRINTKVNGGGQECPPYRIS